MYLMTLECTLWNQMLSFLSYKCIMMKTNKVCAFQGDSDTESHMSSPPCLKASAAPRTHWNLKLTLPARGQPHLAAHCAPWTCWNLGINPEFIHLYTIHQKTHLCLYPVLRKRQVPWAMRSKSCRRSPVVFSQHPLGVNGLPQKAHAVPGVQTRECVCM